ncbi:hypothetical protein Aab01nite_82700 [Paractinoplanes abujensis]|nr:hypothetical protein Aab01nite_82700 [Actinoplanes abujensis]
MIDQGLLRVHPSSTSDSFTRKEDGSLGDEIYTMRAPYYIRGAGPLNLRVATYISNFASVSPRENWSDHWTDQFSAFWFDVAVAECKAYLVYMLDRHGLAFTPGQKTDDVFRRALKWYSIGQMYRFIWRAAKESAAYFAREQVTAKQAANSAVTRIVGCSTGRLAASSPTLP